MSAILRPFANIETDAIFNEALKPPDSVRLGAVKASKIFNCFYGRNAWHSTWVQKYSPDCMHLTMDSAKAHAERKRVQGSVFYIQELPAVELDVGPYRVFITQINSRCPLREYRCHAVRKSARNGRRLMEGARDRYLSFGVKLKGAVLSFEHDSRFWVTEQPPRNSVITVYSADDTSAAKLHTTPLKTWRSSSVGKYYYLNWHTAKSNVSGRSALRIFKQSGFNAHAG